MRSSTIRIWNRHTSGSRTVLRNVARHVWQMTVKAFSAENNHYLFMRKAMTYAPFVFSCDFGSPLAVLEALRSRFCAARYNKTCAVSFDLWQINGF